MTNVPLILNKGTQMRTLARFLVCCLSTSNFVCMIVFKVVVVLMLVSMIGIATYDTISKVIR